MAEPKITTVQTGADDLQAELLVLHVFERDREAVGFVAKVDRLYDGAISRVLESGDFAGRKGDTLVIYPPDAGCGIRRVLLAGAGKPEDYTVEQLRRAVGDAVRVAERMAIRSMAVSVGHVHHIAEQMGDYYAGLAAVEAAVLATWDFRELKTTPSDDEPRGSLDEVTIIAHDENQARELDRAARIGTITARGENFARDLQTRPGNIATPSYLAERASEMAGRLGLQVTIFDREQMQTEGMHALLAVARGTQEEPRFIIVEYKGGGADDAPLVLVGKGVTFDSGGISIKPAERMEDMKYDMSGAAAVLGAIQAIAELKLKANVVAIVPSTENLPSGNALKPGDVIRSHRGKTIEIINTDAEGRLILADALSYAQRFKPAAIVDCATLTGACVIALGHQAIGVMGNDGRLLAQLRAAGQRTGERCWPLPLWDEYREQIDSPIADIRNSGGRPAGTITAGWFLKEFAGEDVPWAHLDIAGTAYRDEAAPYLRKGATGVPTRLLVDWVRARAEA
ncbi:MAG TPA: leucyl aminopeptidase [Longimicrobiales bacterium]|nr:leucyl aminopeptidase [Longimicrobiales bacterium]